MKTKRKNRLLPSLILIVLLIAILGLALKLRQETANDNRELEIDPHFGMVEVFNGEQNIWIIPEDGVPLNTLTKDDFTTVENGQPRYMGTEFATFSGIDVSEHQGDIDWEQVKSCGIDFAIIRVGGRGYGGEGKLVADEKFAQNLENAKAAGLQVGVYFFSQAINDDEAQQEAEFVLNLLDGAELDLPVYFDWEHITGDTARTDKLSGATVTECAINFCDTIKASGYDASIYTNLDMSYYAYELDKIADYGFWTAAVGSYPYAYYAFSVWQYSFNGKVPGIQQPCDLDMLFVPYN